MYYLNKSKIVQISDNSQKDDTTSQRYAIECIRQHVQYDGKVCQ